MPEKLPVLLSAIVVTRNYGTHEVEIDADFVSEVLHGLKLTNGTRVPLTVSDDSQLRHVRHLHITDIWVPFAIPQRMITE